MKTTPLARAGILATVATLTFAGCSSDEDDADSTSYPSDPLAAMERQCNAFREGKGCDRKCILDGLNMNEFNGAKCEEGKGLTSEDVKPFNTCTESCAVLKDCAPYAVGKHRDCACERECASKHLTKRAQGLYAYSGDCKAKLPSCQ